MGKMSTSAHQPYFDPWDPSYQANPYARFKPLGVGVARCEAVKAISALLERFPKLRLADTGAAVVYKPTFFIRGIKSLPMAVD